ncbi:MAG: hypothetical protein ACK5KT_04550 [Dysgonomonas sp.]
MEHCQNCHSVIEFDANMCVKCGWRPYHGVQQGNMKYFPLINQNFRNAGLISMLLSCLMIALYLFPLWLHSESLSEDMALYILFVDIFSIILLTIWQISQLYKYLHNFYHPLDNIFMNLRWMIACILLLSVLFISGLVFKPSRMLEGGLLLLSIGLFVLWIFMQILIGWSLIKVDQYDYVGGLSALGYGMLAAGIVPPLIIFTPFFWGNLFFKAYKYNKRLNAAE